MDELKAKTPPKAGDEKSSGLKKVDLLVTGLIVGGVVASIYGIRSQGEAPKSSLLRSIYTFGRTKKETPKQTLAEKLSTPPTERKLPIIARILKKLFRK